MTYPSPLPGLVIRYSFLWSREARSGATEGRKDRPCAIVVAVPRDESGDTRVVVVPVTHSAPADPATAILLPTSVKAALGLDPAPSWVCLNELNIFSWPGYDLRPIAGSDRIAYGALPKPLFERIRRGVVGLDRARKARLVPRIECKAARLHLPPAGPISCCTAPDGRWLCR